MTYFEQLDSWTTFFCPACKCRHGFDSRWKISGEAYAPTVRPSIIVRDKKKDPETGKLYDVKLCHLFISHGKIEYLDDCTNAYAGEVVELIDITNH